MKSTTDSTSSSLLERVKAHDAQAWRRFSNLYGPLVYGWARQSNVQPADAADVVQEVFSSVAANIGRFKKERPEDSFRGWLWTVARSKICDHFRGLTSLPTATGGSDAHQLLQQVPQSPPGQTDQTPSATTSQLSARAMSLIQSDFAEQTWTAFLRVVVNEETPSHVAGDLGVSVWTVYKAKSRVLARLREELGDLEDW